MSSGTVSSLSKIVLYCTSHPVIHICIFDLIENPNPYKIRVRVGEIFFGHFNSGSMKFCLKVQWGESQGKVQWGKVAG